MRLSPLQRYEQAISSEDFTRDEQQYIAMSYLDDLYHKLNNTVEEKKGIFGFFKSKPTAPKGLYMWGGVGRGKTSVSYTHLTLPTIYSV